MDKEMLDKKVYLGDSVYATFDGYHIVLTTENGVPGDPSNRIALEPTVLRNLSEYEKQLYKEREEKALAKIKEIFDPKEGN